MQNIADDCYCIEDRGPITSTYKHVNEEFLGEFLMGDASTFVIKVAQLGGVPIKRVRKIVETSMLKP
jgi:hypothetical protein